MYTHMLVIMVKAKSLWGSRPLNKRRSLGGDRCPRAATNVPVASVSRSGSDDKYRVRTLQGPEYYYLYGSGLCKAQYMQKPFISW